MVNLKNLEIYCADYENIENFQEALNDEEELWTFRKREDLIKREK